jgi:hypothetical protein
VTGFIAMNWTPAPMSGTVDITLTPTEQPILTHSQGAWAGLGVFQRSRAVGLRADATVSGSIVVGAVTTSRLRSLPEH